MTKVVIVAIDGLQPAQVTAGYAPNLAAFAAAGAALVHALIPCLFEKTASGIIAKLYARTHNRGQ